MTVTSLLFLALAALAAVVYRRLPFQWRNSWLVLVSAVFIATWSWKFILILAAFALINFLLAKKIDPGSPSRKKWVWLGVIFNILVLFIFKYNKFFLPEFEQLLNSMGILHPGAALQILLPVGLSFLMVQVVSYLIDVSHDRLKAENNLLKFGVYILYFPKLVSGPIERARQFLAELDSPLPFNRPLAERSTALILTGLFRKLVFANPLFNLVPPDAFVTPSNYSGQNLFFWLLAYAFALYNDFAGYTLIVRGVSLWFGIELTNNFNLPYLSRNFTEFWTRWHITLSNWLRDYIYFPLSRSLLKRFPKRNHFLNFVFPPMLTMLVSGMWHGLSWSMLVWGGLHGLYLIVERVPGLWHPITPLDEQPRWRQNLGVAITFLFASLAWVPFRMEIPVALEYWKGLICWSLPNIEAIRSALAGQIYSWSVFNLPNPILILLLLGAASLDLIQNRQKSETPVLGWRRSWQIVFILILLTAALLALFADTIAPFVYQSF
jgi:alginate O-acetyltransferase complex protein AlgI